MPRGAGAVSAEKLAEWRRVPLNRSPIAHPYLHEPFLPAPEAHKAGKMLLVLDIDETLVHASFAPNKPYHVRLTVEVENDRGHIYVAFRPHLAVFLREVADLFEVAIFTASQACYADQLMNILDPHRRLGSLRLFRDRCTETRGGRVKDLSLLGRPLDRVAIVDNSPIAYAYQRRNAIPILSWFDDPTDTELLKLLPMLRELAKRPNVYEVLDPFNASAL
jgi:RNA polymerase II subunit A small phosphatase-like protein